MCCASNAPIVQSVDFKLHLVLIGRDSIDVALKLLKTPPTLVLNTVLLDYFCISELQFTSCS